MRTTLDIPKKLIDEAMRISQAKTKSEAIRYALEQLIKQEQRVKLLTFIGKVDLAIDLDDIRGRKQ